MPANLTPEFLKAKEKYQKAQDKQGKIEALKEMLATVPKHKGTENIQADIKRKLANLRKKSQKKGPAKTKTLDSIKREGAGQVVLVGLPNSGKSTLLEKLTNAKPEVAEYPFSTFKPLPGMMNYEDIQIQLVDIPPISKEHTESWVFNLIRKADLLLVLIDLNHKKIEENILETIEILNGQGIHLMGANEEEEIRVFEIVKRAVFVGTRRDAGSTGINALKLQEKMGTDFSVISVSVKRGKELEQLGKTVFRGLNIIRIYTKVPGKKPDLELPYVLPKGSTVMDAAKSVHRELAEDLSYVRIWGSGKFDGQQVGWDHVLEDGDIIEIHT